MRNNKIMSDIKRIDNAIKNNNQQEFEELHEELYQTYKTEIKDLDKSLLELSSWADTFHNINAEDYEQIPVRTYPENYKKNLIIIKGKLELMVVPASSKGGSGINVNVVNDNKNTASSSVDLKINIQFDEVKEQIKNMDDKLDDATIEEIISRIDLLESIIKSKDKKSDKWRKVKEIGKWVFDKSVDVGIALLPLFLKIGE